MTLYWAANGAMPTTAPIAAVTTGTATKTMLQIATSATKKIRVVKWGVQCATTPTAAITCDLIQADTAATVTAHIAAGIQPYSDAGAPASSVQLGTALSGYTSSSETAPTVTRNVDHQTLQIGQSSFEWEWSLGREFDVAVSRFLRLRMTTTVAVNAVTWLIWDE